ncbi:MAG: hypothetical protein IJ890_06430 [Clostridia bacterium]|nr:hypothetical protein [Clostridia bacterium]
MKKDIIMKVIITIEFILMLLCLLLKIDWLLIVTTILMAVCVVLSFFLKDK